MNVCDDHDYGAVAWPLQSVSGIDPGDLRVSIRQDSSAASPNLDVIEIPADQLNLPGGEEPDNPNPLGRFYPVLADDIADPCGRLAQQVADLAHCEPLLLHCSILLQR